MSYDQPVSFKFLPLAWTSFFLFCLYARTFYRQHENEFKTLDVDIVKQKVNFVPVQKTAAESSVQVIYNQTNGEIKLDCSLRNYSFQESSLAKNKRHSTLPQSLQVVTE